MPTATPISLRWVLSTPRSAGSLPRMDSHLVWGPAAGRLEVKEFRRVNQGELVAIATKEDGFEDETDVTLDETFAFMESEAASCTL